MEKETLANAGISKEAKANASRSNQLEFSCQAAVVLPRKGSVKTSQRQVWSWCSCVDKAPGGLGSDAFGQ